MIHSVRGRLTLWHSAVLAALLVAFTLGAFAFVRSTSRARTTAAVVDAIGDLKAQFLDERPQQPTATAAAREVIGELRFRSLAFAVYDAHGAPVAVTLPRPHPSAEEQDPDFDPASLTKVVRAVRPGETAHLTVGDREGGYRVALEGVATTDGPMVLAAAAPLHEEVETLQYAAAAASIAIPIALLLSVAGGAMLARRSLEPMVVLHRRIAAIEARDLSARVPVENAADEVGQLAEVVNSLLARLEQAFAEQRQFMADASHELRTPVAVVQHEASLALARAGRSAAEYEDALGVIRDAGRRMRRLVDDLFLLARADAHDLAIHREHLYLDDVISGCLRELRTIADARRVVLTSSVTIEAPFEGDEALLHRLVCNLVENALRYAGEGGRVDVALSLEHDCYRVAVSDSGPGVPDHMRERIFERFVRADPSRVREENAGHSGAGLGLPIARSIAAVHGGAVTLEATSHEGSRFVLTLPAAPTGEAT